MTARTMLPGTSCVNAANMVARIVTMTIIGDLATAAMIATTLMSGMEVTEVATGKVLVTLATEGVTNSIRGLEMGAVISASK